MIFIISFVFLVQIFSLLIFKPLAEILNYFFEGKFIPIFLLIIFAFLISKNTDKDAG